MQRESYAQHKVRLFGLQAELLLLRHEAEEKKHNIQDQPNFKTGLEEVKKKNSMVINTQKKSSQNRTNWIPLH